MDIVESVRKLQCDEQMVIGRFYTRFLNRNPDINRLFHGIDIPRQSVMLTTALNIVELYYTSESAVARASLAMLGRRHQELGATREMYAVFHDCLLETLSEYHGDDWNEPLQQQWSEAIQQAIDAMLAEYL